MDDFSALFNSWRRSGQLTSMNVDTASDITLLLKYAVGKLPIEDFWSEFGEPKVTASPLDRLDMTLGRAVDELSRPVDAIRHQAKTVTVGTSRRVEAPRGLIFDAIEDLSFTVENIPAKGGIALKRLQDAVLRINGYTLYAVQGLDEEGSPTERSTVRVIRKQGTAEGLRSRFDETGPLMGTKKTIVRTGDVYAGLGKSDRAPIVIVPLLNPLKTVEHLLLLHVEYDEAMDVARKKEILGEKFGDIKNIIDDLLFGKNACSTSLWIELYRHLDRWRIIAECTPIGGHERLLHHLNDGFFRDTSLCCNLRDGCIEVAFHRSMAHSNAMYIT